LQDISTSIYISISPKKIPIKKYSASLIFARYFYLSNTRELYMYLFYGVTGSVGTTTGSTTTGSATVDAVTVTSRVEDPVFPDESVAV